LYDFRVELIQQCLASPPRQPEYRLGRAHRDFVGNLPIDATELQRALWEVWQETRDGAVSDSTSDCTVPVDQTAVAELARVKYEADAWTQKL
jgi:lipoate-protein ligase A